MTVKELKIKAKELGLTGYSKLRKSELEELIAKTNMEKEELTLSDVKEIVPPIVDIYEYKNDEQWHELRSLGIGGSDIGALLGVNKWKSAIDVYTDKTQGHENIENRFTHFGHKLEKVVFEEFAERHPGLKCYQVPYTIKRGACVANVDGMVYDPEKDRYGVLELKTTSEYNKEDWLGDTVPQSYYAQVQHYLYVTGLSFAYIACLIGGNDYKQFYIERNLDDIDLIKETAEKFWKENVLKSVPPMLDGTDAYSKYLLERAEKEDDEVVELDELTTKGNEYKELKDKIEELEKELRLKEQEILLEMNNNSCKKAKAGDFKFTIVTTNRKTVDKKALEKDHGDLIEQVKVLEEQYTTIKQSSYLKITNSR